MPRVRDALSSTRADDVARCVEPHDLPRLVALDKREAIAPSSAMSSRRRPGARRSAARSVVHVEAAQRVLHRATPTGRGGRDHSRVALPSATARDRVRRARRRAAGGVAARHRATATLRGRKREPASVGPPDRRRCQTGRQTRSAWAAGVRREGPKARPRSCLRASACANRQVSHCARLRSDSPRWRLIAASGPRLAHLNLAVRRDPPRQAVRHGLRSCRRRRPRLRVRATRPAHAVDAPDPGDEVAAVTGTPVAARRRAVGELDQCQPSRLASSSSSFLTRNGIAPRLRFHRREWQIRHSAARSRQGANRAACAATALAGSLPASAGSRDTAPARCRRPARIAISVTVPFRSHPPPAERARPAPPPASAAHVLPHDVAAATSACVADGGEPRAAARTSRRVGAAHDRIGIDPEGRRNRGRSISDCAAMLPAAPSLTA